MEGDLTMTRENSLACEYLGWGRLEELKSRPLAENEAFLSTMPVNSPGALVRGFLDAARSPEQQAKIPTQYSENDLAEPIVEMVRTLPEDAFQEWSNSSNQDKVVGAILHW